MTSAINIENCSLKDRVIDGIADSQVRAAIFSTYTFSRRFFEGIVDEVLCSNGDRKGLFPITVLLDQNFYRGHGFGYDVYRFSGRLWHPKIIALMLEDNQRSFHSRTLFFIGSGNLTPSGWQENSEVFLSLEWPGWCLPKAVENWLHPSFSFANNSRFSQWYFANRDDYVPKRIDQGILGNATGESLWNQWIWSGSWSEAHIIAPFTDTRSEEDNQPSAGYFAELVKLAESADSSLSIYLQGTSDKKVIGNWNLFHKLSRKVELRIYSVNDSRRLHAKLQAVKVGSTWQIMGGSPNATSKAMIEGKRENANVELAWKCSAQRLPNGLLPKSEPVDLREENFIRPPIYSGMPRRWVVLESVRYDPKTKKLEPTWHDGHGLHDTIVRFVGEELDLTTQVNLGNERSITTEPRDLTVNKNYEADWVPIDIAEDVSDDPVFDKRWSLEEFIAFLSGSVEDAEGGTNTTKQPLQSGTHAAPTLESFDWYEKVDSLERALENLRREVENCITPQRLSYYLRMANGCLEATDESDIGLPPMERHWRNWVRFEIVTFLLSLNKHRTSTEPFLKLGAKWGDGLDPYLIKVGQIHE